MKLFLCSLVQIYKIVVKSKCLTPKAAASSNIPLVSQLEGVDTVVHIFPWIPVTRQTRNRVRGSSHRQVSVTLIAVHRLENDAGGWSPHLSSPPAGLSLATVSCSKPSAFQRPLNSLTTRRDADDFNQRPCRLRLLFNL